MGGRVLWPHQFSNVRCSSRSCVCVCQPCQMTACQQHLDGILLAEPRRLNACIASHITAHVTPACCAIMWVAGMVWLVGLPCTSPGQTPWARRQHPSSHRHSITSRWVNNTSIASAISLAGHPRCPWTHIFTWPFIVFSGSCACSCKVEQYAVATRPQLAILVC